MGAVSASNTQFAVPPVLREALEGRAPAPAPAVGAYARGLRAFAVPPRLSVAEAAALFEVWARDLALHTGMWPRCFWSAGC